VQNSDCSRSRTPTSRWCTSYDERRPRGRAHSTLQLRAWLHLVNTYSFWSQTSESSGSRSTLMSHVHACATRTRCSASGQTSAASPRTSCKCQGWSGTLAEIVWWTVTPGRRLLPLSQALGIPFFKGREDQPREQIPPAPLCALIQTWPSSCRPCRAVRRPPRPARSD